MCQSILFFKIYYKCEFNKALTRALFQFSFNRWDIWWNKNPSVTKACFFTSFKTLTILFNTLNLHILKIWINNQLNIKHRILIKPLYIQSHFAFFEISYWTTLLRKISHFTTPKGKNHLKQRILMHNIHFFKWIAGEPSTSLLTTSSPTAVASSSIQEISKSIATSLFSLGPSSIETTSPLPSGSTPSTSSFTEESQWNNVL